MALGLLCALLLPACESEELQGPVPACDHLLWGLSPDFGPTTGGTEVTVSGIFIASDEGRDVVVRVGGTDADVQAMARTGCDACFACANEALSCAACDRECRGLAPYTDAGGTTWEQSECQETLTFTTPAGAAGEVPVTIINSRGSSDDLSFTYEPDGDDDDSAAGDDDDSAR